jgi:D-alanyl-D-alanine carboxypeptidase
MSAARLIRNSLVTASLHLAIAVLALVLAAGIARAQSDRYSSIVVDAATDNVLSAVNADEPRHPASLTKMMTLYLVFEALRDRRITLDQAVPVSSHAASMPPSKLGLLPGTRIIVQEAIFALVTRSANDAASALGELLGGDEDRFAEMMTLRARALGMSHTVFRNASGLPDPDQVTTARDMATLARHLVVDFPDEYRWFSTPSFTWHRQTIFNHDRMLQSYPGADGIKTGYIDSAGHNLVTSAVHGDVRLIGVIFGAPSNGERDLRMTALLDQGFDRMGAPSVARIASRLPSLVGEANAAPVPRHIPVVHWVVQAGSFPSPSAAREAAALARHAADDGAVRIEAATVHGRTTWRALLTGLSQSEAHQACSALARHKMACTPVRTASGQLANG